MYNDSTTKGPPCPQPTKKLKTDNGPPNSGWGVHQDIPADWAGGTIEIQSPVPTFPGARDILQASEPPGDMSLVLPSDASQLQAMIKKVYKEGLVPCHSLELPVTTDGSEYKPKEEYGDVTGTASAYQEEVDDEAEEPEEEGLGVLHYDVGKLLKVHPNHLSLAYSLSTSKSKAPLSALDLPDTFLDMIRAWKAATKRVQDKFEAAWSKCQSAYKKAISSATMKRTEFPLEPKRGEPDVVYVMLSNCSTSSSGAEDSPPTKGNRKGKKGKKTKSPPASAAVEAAANTSSSDATTLIELKKVHLCYEHGRSNMILPGGKHIEISNEDWSFWALALNKKVDSVSYETPPPILMNCWLICNNISAPMGTVCAVTCPQKMAEVAQAAAQSILQGLGLPWTLFGPPSMTPSVAGHQFVPPSGAGKKQDNNNQDVRDLIEDSSAYPALDLWLSELNTNPIRNVDD
ncbi:hypothetical protein CALCODRAFT_506269 [Calocera cornea HHB12733]|uniref:Uncharacterized protein n=1 Tax=Calocera cornea HHB12733 TaxID=1353952 RepID=A0A165J1H7_9BASI|nr:hypothetical protein CALCODRAFT_506269 [Calocera cornea HHB12733]